MAPFSNKCKKGLPAKLPGGGRRKGDRGSYILTIEISGGSILFCACWLGFLPGGDAFDENLFQFGDFLALFGDEFVDGLPG